jgi:hypothetical protein
MSSVSASGEAKGSCGVEFAPTITKRNRHRRPKRLRSGECTAIVMWQDLLSRCLLVQNTGEMEEYFEGESLTSTIYVST